MAVGDGVRAERKSPGECGTRCIFRVYTAIAAGSGLLCRDRNIANASGTHCARDFDYESNMHGMRVCWLFSSYWKPEADAKCYSRALG